MNPVIHSSVLLCERKGEEVFKRCNDEPTICVCVCVSTWCPISFFLSFKLVSSPFLLSIPFTLFRFSFSSPFSSKMCLFLPPPRSTDRRLSVNSEYKKREERGSLKGSFCLSVFVSLSLSLSLSLCMINEHAHACPYVLEFRQLVDFSRCKLALIA